MWPGEQLRVPRPGTPSHTHARHTALRLGLLHTHRHGARACTPSAHGHVCTPRPRFPLRLLSATAAFTSPGSGDSRTVGFLREMRARERPCPGPQWGSAPLTWGASMEPPRGTRVCWASALQIKPVEFTVHAVVTTSDLELVPSELDFGYCTIHEAVRAPVRLCNHSLLPQEFGFVGLPKVPCAWGHGAGSGRSGDRPGICSPSPGGLTPPWTPRPLPGPPASALSPRAPSPPHPAPLAPSLWPAVLQSPRPRSAPSRQFPCLPGPSGQLRLGPSLAIRTPPRLSTQTPPSCHTCATHRHEHARAHMHSRMLHTCGHTTQTRNTRVLTHMHAHTHVRTFTCMHSHTDILTCIHTCVQTHMQTGSHTCAHVLRVCR